MIQWCNDTMIQWYNPVDFNCTSWYILIERFCSMSHWHNPQTPQIPDAKCHVFHITMSHATSDTDCRILNASMPYTANNTTTILRTLQTPRTLRTLRTLRSIHHTPYLHLEPSIIFAAIFAHPPTLTSCCEVWETVRQRPRGRFMTFLHIKVHYFTHCALISVR